MLNDWLWKGLLHSFFLLSELLLNPSPDRARMFDFGLNLNRINKLLLFSLVLVILRFTRIIGEFHQA